MSLINSERPLYPRLFSPTLKMQHVIQSYSEIKVAVQSIDEIQIETLTASTLNKSFSPFFAIVGA
jgi:hypothetical protein